jgi:hypothetical protein
MIKLQSCLTILELPTDLVLQLRILASKFQISKLKTMGPSFLVFEITAFVETGSIFYFPWFE